MAIETIIVFAFAAFLAVIAGLMFLKGYFHEESNTRWRRTIDPDKLFFPDLKSRELIGAADRLAFLVCVCTASLIAIYGTLAAIGLLESTHAMKLAPSLLVGGVLASWVIRFIFILLYKGRPSEKIPRMRLFGKG